MADSDCKKSRFKEYTLHTSHAQGRDFILGANAIALARRGIEKQRGIHKERRNKQSAAYPGGQGSDGIACRRRWRAACRHGGEHPSVR